jgi:hypothetical protein
MAMFQSKRWIFRTFGPIIRSPHLRNSQTLEVKLLLILKLSAI